MTPHNKILTLEDEQKIVSMYKDGYTTGEIHKVFSKVKQRKSIIDTLHRHGIKGRKKWEYVNINHHAFENIDNEAAAYFLGLMITDGWVRDNTNEIAIQLDAQDKYILEEFAKFLQVDCPLIETRGMYRFTARSPHLKQDLKKYGVVPRKTFTTYLPKISEEMMPHLLRGLMDGDGCVFIDKKGRGWIQFAGTYQLCEKIGEFLAEILSVKQEKIRPIHTIYAITWCRQPDVKKLIQYLWSTNARHYLKRKYEKTRRILKRI